MTSTMLGTILKECRWFVITLSSLSLPRYHPDKDNDNDELGRTPSKMSLMKYLIAEIQHNRDFLLQALLGM